MVCAGATEYIVLGEFLAPPFIVAATLVVLSLAAGRQSRAVSWIALVLSLLIPVGAVAGHIRGDLVLAVPIFDALVFGWLFWNALPGIRTSAA
ncbi:MAG: hypothetical protein JRG76_16265 [Deltaproteobacteria bacterium]|nr:hypothetical protein [Deltaproteobacteria bacterium]